VRWRRSFANDHPHSTAVSYAPKTLGIISEWLRPGTDIRAGYAVIEVREIWRDEESP
jgi:hypothetical protein